MKKAFFVVLATSFITLFIVLSSSSAQVKNEEERLSDVVDLTVEKYHVLASSILSEESVVFFDIADTEDKKEVHKFIQESLEDRDLQYYGINIIQSNVKQKEKEFGK